MRFQLWFGLSAVVLALGCDDQAGGAASPSATAKATAAATGSPKPAETAEKKAANKTVKAADLNEAYEGIFNDLKTMKDPMETKVAAFIAKIGEPAKTDGDKKIWYAVDGDKCESAVLGTDGALSQTVVDKAECGL